MKKFGIYGVYALLGMALTFGVTACSSSDPDTDSVEPTPVPPVVEVVNTISGMVTDMSGDPIEGAVVTLDTTSCITDSVGFYKFEKEVQVGDNTISVTATEKIGSTGVANVPDTETGSNVVLNFTLANVPKTVKLEKQEDGSASTETETEVLKNNDAAIIPMEVVAPAGAVEDEEAEITVTPTYSETQTEATTKAGTRATEDKFLIGSQLACSKPDLTLKKDIDITYDLDPEVAQAVTAKKYKNGQWVDAKDFNVNNGKVIVKADEFTQYALFFSASITFAQGTQTLTFAQNTWDNTKGTSSMTVGNAEYTYKIGTDVSAQSNKIKAYLVEMIVRLAGAGCKTVKGSYPINVTLPECTGLKISGTQAVEKITASFGTTSVTATRYGDVTIVTSTWAVKRNHTGGSSK